MESNQIGEGKKRDTKLTPEEAKRRILKTKQGKRYVLLNAKKRVKVKPDISERELIKWIIKHLRPRRRKKTNAKNTIENYHEPPVTNFTYSTNVENFDRLQNELREAKKENKVAQNAIAVDVPRIAPADVKKIEDTGKNEVDDDEYEFKGKKYKAPRELVNHMNNAMATTKAEAEKHKQEAAKEKKEKETEKSKKEVAEAKAEAKRLQEEIDKMDARTKSLAKEKYVEQIDKIKKEYKTTHPINALKKYAAEKGVPIPTGKSTEEMVKILSENKTKLKTESELHDIEINRMQNRRTKLQDKVVQLHQFISTPEADVKEQQDEPASDRLLLETPAAPKSKKSESKLPANFQSSSSKDVGFDDDIQGDGTSSQLDKDGLYETQINDMMGKYKEYLGTVAVDEVATLKIPAKSQWGAIINLGKRASGGTHWVSLYGDSRPNGSQSIEFYNSFGEPAPKAILRVIKPIANDMHAENYLRFKENRIVQQSDESANCGYFAMKFLIDRFRGKPFAECTQYDDHLKGEKNIEEWKQKLDIKPFKLVSSFGGEGLMDFVKRVKAVITGKRDRWPPNVMRWLKDHGDEAISSITVVREPIKSYIDKALNLMSLGGWERAKSDLGYSDMFHLFMVIKFAGGEDAVLERNHVVEMYKNNGKSYANAETMSVSTGKITLNELLGNAMKKIGTGILKYNASDNNCQVFIMQLLRASGLASGSIETFVMQDAKSLISKLNPVVKKIVDTVVDVADRADAAVNGAGKFTTMPVKKPLD